MKNELLQRGDCLKYWKKYGQNTLLYPLALRSGTEALPPAPPSSSRPERLSANAFPTPGPKRFLTTVPFFNWHKVLLGILALSEWKALGPKTRWSCGVGRRREVFVYNSHRHWALLINQASLRCLAAGVTFCPQTFLFVSGRGAHGKVHQEIKAAKVVFHTRQLRVYVLLCTVSLSSPDAAFPSPEGPSLPGGVSGASLNSDERQHVFSVLPSTVSLFRCRPWGERSLHQGFMGALVLGGTGRALPALCPGKG